ncbi:MAG: ferritin-like domain-containing protein [Chitinophagales bacterium]|nr:ferritin-like domain-containing protein [Chitinophagales bacterium]
MKILNILNKLNLESTDTKRFNKAASRRDLFKLFGETGKTIAAAAVPVALVSLASKKANAYVALQGPLEDVLNFALTLEYLEAEFYTLGLNASGLIPNGDATQIFQQISKHENAHVTFLQDTISSLGTTPVSKPTFDFTAGGTFDAFGDYATFLALSQAFEDTGVRAYKGGAASLMSNDAVLTAALQIHSVEARHASEVRRLRGLKGWITQDQRGTGMPAQTQAVYDGEQNTTHGGVNATTVTSIGSDGLTEAFDEPLDMQSVLNIANLFIVP